MPIREKPSAVETRGRVSRTEVATRTFQASTMVAATTQRASATRVPNRGT